MSPEITGLLIGLVFIPPTIWFVRQKHWDALAWPAFLVTLPVYYMLFGVLAGDGWVVMKELLFGLPYVATGLIVGRIRSPGALIVIALAWLSHGFYDFYHDVFFVNPGVFSWYPSFCALVDIAVAGYLLLDRERLLQASVATQSETAG